MSIFPGGGSPPRPAPPPPPPPYVPPPPVIPPEPEGKKVDKQKARYDIARRAGRRGSVLTGARGSSGGLGNVSRPETGGSDKLG
jgi:hypothetical protein